MYKLVDLTDCLVREFDDLDELDTFCQTVWKLQYLEQAIKLDKKIEDMVFEYFKVYSNTHLIKEMNGEEYISILYNKI
jgi:hypothetical protein